MKNISITLLFCAGLLISGCKNDKKDSTDNKNTETTTSTKEEVKKIRVTIEPKSGSSLSGNAVFTEENGEVTMTAIIDGLPEGMHAIHLHESADCASEDGSSAGGHWNPTFEKHGIWGASGGYHKGDIGNFKVDTNGNGTITMTTDEWCIGCDDESKNIVGKAIVIHDGVDDFTSQPAGNAGTRVGCGSIRQ
ncbi:superoxide dismutase family protein [Antarcticibacterium arcticum]|uniref:Superoxide dismutase [Cu-Zn] n=1 Tax=Antarcticibacterium arcticum TaxID=2585771 RepID=A0A5B8YHH9_9FLAO|nr:superoxide dismutase family protein [Antarcticibacterium arcticum]QED37295.1 superoxide dismutase family protein [Antarcticibacterium arcticum]